MSKNIITFKPRQSVLPGCGVNEKQAWENFDILKNIIQANINATNGNLDECWFILSASMVN